MGYPNTITIAYLRAYPNIIFVFGDSLHGRGYGGAAALRDGSNTYGFLTKKAPANFDGAFYHPEEYTHIFEMELQLLKSIIEHNKDKTYLISKIGAGLANRFGIFENVIEPRIKKELEYYPNVEFLW